MTWESDGTDTLYYYYNGARDLFGFKYNGVNYYYIKNAQGDIIQIVDDSGSVVVAYTYDTWGKLVSITGSAATTLGVANPYRYRGYRYDNETGLYFLNSRYYDPEVGRFINADAILSVFSRNRTSNAFSYAGNNPVTFWDLDGYLVTMHGYTISAASLAGVSASVVFAQDDNGGDAELHSVSANYWGTPTLSTGAFYAVIDIDNINELESTDLYFLGGSGGVILNVGYDEIYVGNPFLDPDAVKVGFAISASISPKIPIPDLHMYNGTMTIVYSNKYYSGKIISGGHNMVM